MTIESKIEAILFFRNEPVSLEVLSKLLNESRDNIQNTIYKLQKEYENRGIVIVYDGENACLGTHPDLSGMIEELQKEELSRDLGRAGLETLSIVLYKGPISRREIDYIRGVNSGYTLRTLLVRGLIERTEIEGERSYSYKPTIKLLEYLGVSRKEDLPEYGQAVGKIEEFLNLDDNQEQDA